jgi:hypothetical protein
MLYAWPSVELYHLLPRRPISHLCPMCRDLHHHKAYKVRRPMGVWTTGTMMDGGGDASETLECTVSVFRLGYRRISIFAMTDSNSIHPNGALPVHYFTSSHLFYFCPVPMTHG